MITTDDDEVRIESMVLDASEDQAKLKHGIHLVEQAKTWALLQDVHFRDYIRAEDDPYECLVQEYMFQKNIWHVVQSKHGLINLAQTLPIGALLQRWPHWLWPQITHAEPTLLTRCSRVLHWTLTIAAGLFVAGAALHLFALPPFVQVLGAPLIYFAGRAARYIMSGE